MTDNPLVNTSPNHSNNFVWDLSKIALTSLALFTAAGCQKAKSVEAIIAERPVATPQAIVSNPEQWLDKQVTVYAQPTLVKDNSVISFSTGARWSHSMLDLDVNYKVDLPTPVDGKDSLKVELYRSIDVCGRPIKVSDISAPYRLHPDTNVASGTVKKYSDSGNVYLHVDTSMRQSK